MPQLAAGSTAASYLKARKALADDAGRLHATFFLSFTESPTCQTASPQVVLYSLLQALLEAFDATHVTSGMLWALIQGWCGDVAAALASHAPDVEPSVQMAANAAAGRWPAVVSSPADRLYRTLYASSRFNVDFFFYGSLCASFTGESGL